MKGKLLQETSYVYCHWLSLAVIYTKVVGTMLEKATLTYYLFVLYITKHITLLNNIFYQLYNIFI